MLQLSAELQSAISPFRTIFSRPVWSKAQTLLCAAICCPGSRTICNLLRCAGLAQHKAFHKYHRLLSRDQWSALKGAQILLTLLVNTFVKLGAPLVFGIDETIERRWGTRIAKRGIYRDAVRSSASHFAKCSGLRWMSVMLLSPLPWLKKGCWALPVITALCPSARYWKKRDLPRGHKDLMSWAAQLMAWLGRYATGLGRSVYLVGDGSYATYELMGRSIELDIGLIVRMRMDARLYHFPPPPVKGKRGPKPKIGKRILDMTKRLTDRRIKWTEVSFTEWYGQSNQTMLVTQGRAIWSRNAHQKVVLCWVLIKDPEGKLDPVLLGCTQCELAAVKMVSYFVRRWRVEVTFAEVRRHLGVETQRQWSKLAIERSTPLLMSLMSIVCLLAVPLHQQQKIMLETTAWYRKTEYTFSSVLGAVRQHIWESDKFSTLPQNTEVNNLRAKVRYLQQLLTQAVA